VKSLESNSKSHHQSSSRSTGSNSFDTLRVAFAEAKIKEEGITKMNDMNNEKSGFPFIRLALVGIAGYALWRNRARISSLISSTGIKEKVLAALPAELDAGKMIDSGRSLVKEGQRHQQASCCLISARFRFSPVQTGAP